MTHVPANEASAIDPTAACAPGRDALAYLLTAAVVFCVLFPTLPWAQFGGDSEDLVVQSVLEIRHGGSWWIPTLGGEPRIRKPPLVTWISAAAVRPGTVAGLSSPDSATRQAAYRALAWEVRWPALLAACLMIVATAGLTGELLAGRTVGVITAIFCGTTVLFFLFARAATTDVYLGLFVALTNLFLLRALLERRYWSGFIVGGFALGLALMSKDPVCLVQTIVPLAVYFAFCRWRKMPGVIEPWRAWLLPALAGVLCTLAVTLPWYLSIYALVPHALDSLGTELSGQNVSSVSHDPVYFYIMFLPCMTPWIGFFLLGWRRLDGQRIALAAFLLLVPVLLMTFFPGRKLRYLLPMLPPAAILAAYGATVIAKPKSQRTGYESAMLNLQWGTLLAVGVAVPIGAVYLKMANAERWASWNVAIPAAIIGAALIMLAVRRERRGPMAMVSVAALVMLIPTLLVLHGTLHSASNLSEMKPIADWLHDYLAANDPGGRVVYFEPRSPIGKPVTLDLDIYLNQSVPIVHDPAELVGPHPAAAIVIMIRTDVADTSRQVFAELPGWLPLFDRRDPKHPYHFYVLVPVMSASAGG